MGELTMLQTMESSGVNPLKSCTGLESRKTLFQGAELLLDSFPVPGVPRELVCVEASFLQPPTGRAGNIP